MCWRSMLRRYKGDAGSIAPSWGAAVLHPYKGRSRERQTGSGNVGRGYADVIEAGRTCWRSMLRRYKGEAKDRSRRAGVQQCCTPTGDPSLRLAGDYNVGRHEGSIRFLDGCAGR